jgi:hypothetical protein
LQTLIRLSNIGNSASGSGDRGLPSLRKDDEKKLGWGGDGGKGRVGEVRGKEVRKRCFSAGLRLGVDFVKKNGDF